MPRCLRTPTVVLTLASVLACAAALLAQQSDPHADAAAERAALAQVVGWYRFDDLGPALVTWGADADLTLMIVRDTMLGLPLVANAARGDSFAVPAAATRPLGAVRFIRDSAGGVVALRWSDSGRERPAARFDGRYEPHPLAYVARDGITLRATLFLPSGRGPHPAAVMVHGSGASTRDNAWYMTVADALASAGIAVLLPDKRGSGASGGDWRTADLSLLGDDVVAAIRMLQQRADVDSAGVGIIGVSQGGRVAPMAAVTASDAAFVVSLSGAAVPLDEQLRHEVSQDLRRSGWPPFLRPIVRAISLRTIRNRQRDWWERNGKVDPIASWRSLAVPALVVYGEADEADNVPVGRSTERLSALGRSDLTVRVFRGSGHALYAPGTMRIRQDLLSLLPAWVHEVLVNRRH